MFSIFRFIGPMTWDIVILKVPCIVAKMFDNNLPNIVIKCMNIFLRVDISIYKCLTSYPIVCYTSPYHYFDSSRRHWCKMAQTLGSPLVRRLYPDFKLSVRFNNNHHFIREHHLLPLVQCNLPRHQAMRFFLFTFRISMDFLEDLLVYPKKWSFLCTVRRDTVYCY